MEDDEPVSFTSDSKSFQVLRDRLFALKMLQREHSQIEIDFYRQFYALDMEYQKKRQLLYDRRQNIINGHDDLSDSEYTIENTNGMTNALQRMNLMDESAENDGNVNGISNFWLQALKNCTQNDDLIQNGDEEVLIHLRDVKVKLQNEPNLSFTLEFEFGPNPFFTNTILTKQYFLNCDLDDEFCGFSIVKAVGCKIDWKTGMNLMETRDETFFKFFESPALQISDEIEMQSHQIDTTKLLVLQQDFEIGLFIKEKLVPNAVLYYLNELDEVIEECETIGDTDNVIISTTNA